VVFYENAASDEEREGLRVLKESIGQLFRDQMVRPRRPARRECVCARPDACGARPASPALKSESIRRPLSSCGRASTSFSPPGLIVRLRTITAFAMPRRRPSATATCAGICARIGGGLAQLRRQVPLVSCTRCAALARVRVALETG
jgi:hypothetical protein